MVDWKGIVPQTNLVIFIFDDENVYLDVNLRTDQKLQKKYQITKNMCFVAYSKNITKKMYGFTELSILTKLQYLNIVFMT